MTNLKITIKISCNHEKNILKNSATLKNFFQITKAIQRDDFILCGI